MTLDRSDPQWELGGRQWTSRLIATGFAPTTSRRAGR
jgi:hypothetical protein